MNELAYSQRGLQLTKNAETGDGVADLTAYWDKNGKCWTIGFGHTGPDVHEKLVWTQQQCDEALTKDVAFAVHAVNHFVAVLLNQNQFDALVDFTFNEGSGRLQKSTLLKLVNYKRFDLAALEFPKWTFSGSVELPGLVKRRAAEQALFTSP